MHTEYTSGILRVKVTSQTIAISNAMCNTAISKQNDIVAIEKAVAQGRNNNSKFLNHCSIFWGDKCVMFFLN